MYYGVFFRCRLSIDNRLYQCRNIVPALVSPLRLPLLLPPTLCFPHIFRTRSREYDFERYACAPERYACALERCACGLAPCACALRSCVCAPGAYELRRPRNSYKQPTLETSLQAQYDNLACLSRGYVRLVRSFGIDGVRFQKFIAVFLQIKVQADIAEGLPHFVNQDRV
jgi:hypothetical protein